MRVASFIVLRCLRARCLHFTLSLTFVVHACLSQGRHSLHFTRAAERQIQGLGAPRHSNDMLVGTRRHGPFIRYARSSSHNSSCRVGDIIPTCLVVVQEYAMNIAAHARLPPPDP